MRMREPEDTIVEFVPAGEVRRSLVVPGDIQDEVSFQNDLNALIALVDAPASVPPPWRALGDLPGAPSRSRFDVDGLLQALLRRRAA